MASNSDSGIPPLVRDLIEETVYAYESDFANGNAHTLTHYLDERFPEGNGPNSAQPRFAALIELIKVDLELKWQSGERTTLHDYVTAYAELGSIDQLPADLIHEAWRVAQSHSAVDSIETFCDGFPAQRDVVLQIESHHPASSQSQAFSRVASPPEGLAPGHIVCDFELLELLGSGSFAHVFRARQVSLGREVALKVSQNHGREAKTMASLEHEHIVQVFSESVDADTDLRLLCMQYVPGTNLGSVMGYLRERGDDVDAGSQLAFADGSQFINAIDELSTGSVPFQASALRDRDVLKDGDSVEVVCSLGARLAEALHYAHQQGVLHRDIKPDNILPNPFGRPLLADFNLSSARLTNAEISEEIFGGSLAYMAPEHIAAFDALDPTEIGAVDCRSDIYALGVVLFELLAGSRPFPPPVSDADASFQLDALRKQRLSPPRRLRDIAPDASTAVDEVLAKCLSPDPQDRYQTAAEVQQALEDAGQLRSIERAIPKRSSKTTNSTAFWAVLLTILIPNLIGSAVNIAYNYLFIVARLSPAQEDVFYSVMVPFNLIVYPVCIGLLYWYAKPFLHWQSINEGHGDSRDVTRQRLVRFPLFAVAVGGAAWLLGGLVFPAAIHFAAEPIRLVLFAHFLVDFLISGLIALTYSYFGLQAATLNWLYLPLLVGARQPEQTARRELASADKYQHIAQILAGLVPLAGALMLVVIGPLTFNKQRRLMFRVLLFGLIALGMAGFFLAVRFGTRLQRTIDALRGRS